MEFAQIKQKQNKKNERATAKKCAQRQRIYA